mmetsp:Transcript_4054/g.9818  ORF Transcript_4054/g.9818 Transcript_4054/m.9818 type:complete len:551 (-) Transcript_4054:381-2033(-)
MCVNGNVARAGNFLSSKGDNLAVEPSSSKLLVRHTSRSLHVLHYNRVPKEKLKSPSVVLVESSALNTWRCPRNLSNPGPQSRSRNVPHGEETHGLIAVFPKVLHASVRCRSAVHDDSVRHAANGNRQRRSILAVGEGAKIHNPAMNPRHEILQILHHPLHAVLAVHLPVVRLQCINFLALRMTQSAQLFQSLRCSSGLPTQLPLLLLHSSQPLPQVPDLGALRSQPAHQLRLGLAQLCVTALLVCVQGVGAGLVSTDAGELCVCVLQLLRCITGAIVGTGLDFTKFLQLRRSQLRWTSLLSASNFCKLPFQLRQLVARVGHTIPLLSCTFILSLRLLLQVFETALQKLDPTVCPSSSGTLFGYFGRCRRDHFFLASCVKSGTCMLLGAFLEGTSRLQQLAFSLLLLCLRRPQLRVHLFGLPFNLSQLRQRSLHTKLLVLLLQSCVRLSLLALALDFGLQVQRISLFGVVASQFLLSVSDLSIQFLILVAVGIRARDLLKQPGEFLALPARILFDIALEDEEITRLDQQAKRFKLGHVLDLGHSSSVNEKG